jgi:hypothetical protein
MILNNGYVETEYGEVIDDQGRVVAPRWAKIAKEAAKNGEYLPPGLAFFSDRCVLTPEEIAYGQQLAKEIANG